MAPLVGPVPRVQVDHPWVGLAERVAEAQAGSAHNCKAVVHLVEDQTSAEAAVVEEGAQAVRTALEEGEVVGVEGRPTGSWRRPQLATPVAAAAAAWAERTGDYSSEEADAAPARTWARAGGSLTAGAVAVARGVEAEPRFDPRQHCSRPRNAALTQQAPGEA